MYVFTCLIVSVVLAASRLPATKGQEKAKEKSEPSAGSGGKSLEGLLKEAKDAGLDYSRTADGQYRIPVEIGGEASVITVNEQTIMGDEKVACLWCVIAPLPKEFRPSVAMLRRIAEMNCKMLIGNIGMLDKNGIFYDSSFWLRTADVELLRKQLFVAHACRLNFRKELLPYMQEE
jgi:hypothetical protein